MNLFVKVMIKTGNYVGTCSSNCPCECRCGPVVTGLFSCGGHCL